MRANAGRKKGKKIVRVVLLFCMMDLKDPTLALGRGRWGSLDIFLPSESYRSLRRSLESNKKEQFKKLVSGHNMAFTKSKGNIIINMTL